MKKYTIGILLAFIAFGAVAFGTKVYRQIDQIQATGSNEIEMLDNVVLNDGTDLKLEDDAGGETVTIQVPSSVSSSYSLTLPPDDGDVGEVLKTDGSGVLDWVNVGSTSPDASNTIDNVGFTTSVGSSALTISLKTEDGGDPDSGDAIRVAFRSSTATSGVYETVSITAPLSLVISSGSTLGQTSAVADYIYVYLVNNAGTPLLAASGSSSWDEGTLYTTTAEGGAGGADSATVLYASSSVSNKAIRLIGRILNTQATAGTWASAGTELSISPFDRNVLSSSSASERIERVTFGGATEGTNTCSSSPCTIYRSSGGTSSVTRTGTGAYEINFVSGTFSALPTCTGTGTDHATGFTIVEPAFSGSSATKFKFNNRIYNTSSSVDGGSINVICMGPR